MPDLSIKWPVENGPTAQTKKQKLHAYVASLAFHTTPFQMHSEPTNPATSSGQQNGIFRKVGIQVRLTGQKLCILAWDEEQEISLGRLKKKNCVAVACCTFRYSVRDPWMDPLFLVRNGLQDVTLPKILPSSVSLSGCSSICRTLGFQDSKIHAGV
jgi:hypothetical protein